MELIEETKTHKIFLDYYQGNKIRFYLDKKINEVFLNVDDIAVVLGFKDAMEMFSNDEYLDILVETQKKNPNKPILKHT